MNALEKAIDILIFDGWMWVLVLAIGVPWAIVPWQSARRALRGWKANEREENNRG